MNGQISLEFLIVLAAYLAFIAALISMQLRYIDQASFIPSSVRMEARSLAIIASEQLINNDMLAFPIHAVNCPINKTDVSCKIGNSVIDFPLPCDRCDTYDKPIS